MNERPALETLATALIILAGLVPLVTALFVMWHDTPGWLALASCVFVYEGAVTGMMLLDYLTKNHRAT